MRYTMSHYEILLQNVLLRWCHDIGREHAANKPRLSKNRFPGHDEIGQNNVTLVICDKTRVSGIKQIVMFRFISFFFLIDGLTRLKVLLFLATKRRKNSSQNT
ncbi:hypothetical protein Hanom_Chr03g00234841 [Helianthus anomalus]